MLKFNRGGYRPCKTLRCSHTKVESIWLGGLDFAVVCDKNGMNNPLFPPSGTDRDYNAVLFGSLFICRSNLDGTLISIDAEDCEEVLQHISVVQDISDSAPHPMLFDVDMDDTF